MRLTPALMLSSALLLGSPPAGAAGVGKRMAAKAREIDPVALHEKARARMQELDFEKALPLLRQAAAATSLTSVVRAQIWVDVGIVLISLDEKDQAKEAFEKALAEDLSVP